jgi:hypothetical protein
MACWRSRLVKIASIISFLHYVCARAILARAIQTRFGSFGPAEALPSSQQALGELVQVSDPSLSRVLFGLAQCSPL